MEQTYTIFIQNRLDLIALKTNILITFVKFASFERIRQKDAFEKTIFRIFETY